MTFQINENNIFCNAQIISNSEHEMLFLVKDADSQFHNEVEKCEQAGEFNLVHVSEDEYVTEYKFSEWLMEASIANGGGNAALETNQYLLRFYK